MLWLMLRPLRLLRLIGLLFGMVVEAPADAARLAWNLPAVAFYSRLLRREKAQRVHAGFLSWPACIGAGIEAVLRIPFSIAAHARDIFVEPGAVRAKTSRADLVIACTKQGLSELHRLAPPCVPRMHYVPHGIQVDKLPFVPGGPARRDAVIFAVGRLVPKKGFDVLLEAMASLARTGIRLVIAGDGPEGIRLKHVVDRLGLSDRVELLGHQPSQRIMDLMGTCQMLAVPSIIAPDGDRDGLPNVVLEAFSRGLPVVASRLPGIGEAVVHERTGLMVEPGDSADLGRAIARLLDEPALARRLAADARAHVEEHHDLERNIGALASLMRRPREQTGEDRARG